MSMCLCVLTGKFGLLGDMTEFRVWRCARSQADIKRTMNLILHPDGASAAKPAAQQRCPHLMTCWSTRESFTVRGDRLPWRMHNGVHATPLRGLTLEGTADDLDHGYEDVDVTDTSERVAGVLAVGTQVEAKWRGSQWFSGKIVAVNAETRRYVVQYSDGDIEDNVAPERVRSQGVCVALCVVVV